MKTQDSQENIVNIEIVGRNEGICKISVPFPEGEVVAIEQLALHQNDLDMACFGRALCYWQDGSIKWVSLGFFHSADNAGCYELIISAPANPRVGKKNSTKDQLSKELQLVSDEKALTVSSEQFCFVLNLEALSLIARTTDEQKKLFELKSLGGALYLNNQSAVAKLEHWDSRISRDLSGGANGAIELQLEGSFEYLTDKLPLRFVTTIEFYHAAPFVKIQTTLHNPNRAKHPGGIWDLGDEGSELFDFFCVGLTLSENDKVSYQTNPGENWHPATSDINIIQLASGGPNWQSPVHLDRNNQLPLTKNGFEVSCENQIIHQGSRANPTLYSSSSVGVTVEKFWQNFPSSMGFDNHTMRLGLFPSVSGVPHELQGGEQKTHTVWLNLGGQEDSLGWVHKPIIAKLDSKWLARSNALSFFTSDTNDDPIKELIQNGLEHEKNFFSKREAIDEYGWRNFGDLYADHETWRHTGIDLFPSHYNNQYDPIYGFLRQFLLSGDGRWFELADDLAKHVKDIDIYRTEDDKAEYNNGLFWHTAHYLKAYTATHRTCSKHQAADLEPFEDLSGGGPGGQHCYTSGLALYYLLTGDVTAKSAVLKLANWITQVYDGTNTCFELLLFVKNRRRRGIKNQITGSYPFDRGTGNFVIALIDAFQLTEDKSYLHKVEDIIQNTIHSNDDIEKRNLSNIEECWFYIVFLQAVCRYLDIKEEMGDLDTNFYYARDSLLHYADWMLLNEHPYLEKPENLEFVNDTWAAQDLRKSHVFAAAYYYSHKNNNAYLDKAKYFQSYVVDALRNSDQLSYTRIQVLLMQNHGPLRFYSKKTPRVDFAEPLTNWSIANYQQSKYSVFAVIGELYKRLCKLSISNEINWLRKRLEQ